MVPRHLKMYTYNPFGEFKVLNVTDTPSYDNLIISQNVNFHWCQIVMFDDGQEYYDIQLWDNAFRTLNATYVSAPRKSLPDFLQANKNLLFVRAVSQSLDADKMNLAGFFYPLMFEIDKVIVPEALPYEGFSAYLRSMATFSLLGYSISTIAVVILFLSFARLQRQRAKFNFAETVADVLNLLMNDNGNIKYQRLYVVEVMVVLPLTFVGLIVVDGILSSFQSYITRPIIQPQIDSVEELYHSPYRIYTSDSVSRDMIVKALTEQYSRGIWWDKIKKRKSLRRGEDMATFNTSMSYVTPWNTAKVLLRVQKRLNIRGYHIPIPQVSISTSLYAFKTSLDFPFLERFNDIMQNLSQSGLYENWYNSL